jgi:hypothetical protein
LHRREDSAISTPGDVPAHEMDLEAPHIQMQGIDIFDKSARRTLLEFCVTVPEPVATTPVSLRIATDIATLERVAPPGTEIRAYSIEQYSSTWRWRWALLKAALRSDHLVLEFQLPEVMFFSAALFLFPFHRCRFTTFDFFVGRCAGLRFHLVKWSLNRIDRLLVYFKDSRVFEDMFGLPASKFRYVPCKINSIELIRQKRPVTGDYVF